MTTEDGDSVELDDYMEVTRDKDWDLWNGAMGEEMDSLSKTLTWNLVDAS